MHCQSWHAVNCFCNKRPSFSLVKKLDIYLCSVVLRSGEIFDTKMGFKYGKINLREKRKTKRHLETQKWKWFLCILHHATLCKWLISFTQVVEFVHNGVFCECFGLCLRLDEIHGFHGINGDLLFTCMFSGLVVDVNLFGKFNSWPWMVREIEHVNQGIQFLLGQDSEVNQTFSNPTRK